MDLYTLPQLFKSNCPIVEVVAPLIERPRVLNYISGVAGLFQIPTYLCSFGSPELLLFSDGVLVPFQPINGSFFDFLNHWDKSGLFIIENLQSLLGGNDWQSKQQNLEMTSQLVNLFYKLVTRKDCYVVLLSTAGQHLNSTLAGLIPSLVEPLPSPCNLVEYLEDLIAEFPIVSAFDKDELIGAVSGLYQEEIKRGIYYWHCGLLGDIDLVASLLKYKIERFREFGLNFKQPSLMSEFGGLDRLRSALDSVVFRYSAVAQKLGLPLPKGWLMVGPPGTGKTFAAGVCAAKLKVPLVIVDVGAMVAGGVVYVEELLRRVEALGRSVLYFDEFDKLFSANSGDLTGEAATSIQILGKLLTWLQDKTSETFVIATLNRLAALPPELTRKGRFDDIFYVGFPQAIERKQIIELHAARFDRRFKNSSPLSEKEWKILLSRTLNFVGAELAGMVEAAATRKSEKVFNLLAQLPVNPSSELMNELENSVSEDVFLDIQRALKESREVLSTLSLPQGCLKLTLQDFLQERELITPLFVRDTDRILAMENSARYVAQPASSLDNSEYAPSIQSFWGEPAS